MSKEEEIYSETKELKTIRIVLPEKILIDKDIKNQVLKTKHQRKSNPELININNIIAFYINQAL
jgi:hypothetical protein